MATRRQEEQKHDQAVKDSFPASDPPANSGIIGPRVDDPAVKKGDEDRRPKGSPTDDRHRTETAYQDESQKPPASR